MNVEMNEMTVSEDTDLNDDDMVELYWDMVRIREFEDRVQLCYLDGLVHGTTHLCQGQEAVSVGVVKALDDRDYLSYTYRGHGTCVARGISMEGAFAEIFGRVDGVSKGLGGSMHLTDPELNLMGSFGIVGAGLPFAVGLALSGQLRGEGQVSATFFGDGACNTGAFHEAMNLAAIWQLPVIFVCENNLYGEFTRIDHSTPNEDLYLRGASYEMASEAVDGNNVLDVYCAAERAVKRARKGDGPTFLECKTYRQRGHSRTDPGKYRSKEEVDTWLKRDPLILYRAYLLEKGLLQEKEDEEAINEIKEQVKLAADAAAKSPFPEPRDFLPETFSS